MSKLTVAISAIAISACTAVGDLKDSDFTWIEETLPITYQQVFRNLKQGVDRCPTLVFDGHLYDDIREAQVLFHNGNMLGGKAYGIPGKAVIKEAGNNAIVRIGSRGVNDGAGVFGIGEKGWYRKTIMRWAKGDFRCSDKEQQLHQ